MTAHHDHEFATFRSTQLGNLYNKRNDLTTITTLYEGIHGIIAGEHPRHSFTTLLED